MPKTRMMVQMQFRVQHDQAEAIARFVAERRKVRGKVYSRSDALRQALRDFLDAHTV